AGRDVVADLGLEFLLPAGADVSRADLAAALDHAEDDLFILAAGAGDLGAAFRSVHVARFAADEGFIYFNLAAEKSAAALLHRETNPVQHVPCALLSDAERAVNL